MLSEYAGSARNHTDSPRHLSASGRISTACSAARVFRPSRTLSLVETVRRQSLSLQSTAAAEKKIERKIVTRFLKKQGQEIKEEFPDQSRPARWMTDAILPKISQMDVDLYSLLSILAASRQ